MSEESFKIKTKGYEKTLKELSDVNVVYGYTKSELIKEGFVDIGVYKYILPTEPVELEDMGDKIYQVLLDGQPVGTIAKSNYGKIHKLLKSYNHMKIAMLGGASKYVKLRIDYYGIEHYDYSYTNGGGFIGYLRIFTEEDDSDVG